MNHPFHSSNKDVAQRWSQWQPDAPQHDDDKRPDGQPERLDKLNNVALRG